MDMTRNKSISRFPPENTTYADRVRSGWLSSCVLILLVLRGIVIGRRHAILHDSDNASGVCVFQNSLSCTICFLGPLGVRRQEGGRHGSPLWHSRALRPRSRVGDRGNVQVLENIANKLGSHSTASHLASHHINIKIIPTKKEENEVLTTRFCVEDTLI
jgi:hypothetical protein